MSSSPFIVNGLNVQGLVTNRNVLPSLYTVSSGTYGFDSSYGSGKPQSHTYYSVVDKNYSKSQIRQHDNQVDFDIQIALDLTVPAPFNIPPILAPDELRIKPYPFPIISNFISQTFPVSSSNTTLPLFNNVEIIFSDTSAPALSGVVPGILQARLLYGGNFALLAFDPTTGATYTITSANIAPFFNSIIPNQKLLIKVKGTYIGQNSL